MACLGHDAVLKILGDVVPIDCRILSSDADAPPGAIVDTIIVDGDVVGELLEDAVSGDGADGVVAEGDVRAVESVSEEEDASGICHAAHVFSTIGNQAVVDGDVIGQHHYRDTGP